jgi:antitoxin VapB
METIAKLFSNGRSQAVRLPKEFRFKGDRVKIKREGKRVILEPMERTEWPDHFWDFFSSDPDFEIPKPLPSKAVDLD